MVEYRKIVVVIPYFHEHLSLEERISLEQCEKVLNKYEIILLIPKRLEGKELPEHLMVVVPDEWLDSIESYNQMMVNIDFYSRFRRYEYMLIYQLDAIVFSDRLLEFCNMGYDYIGAPWLRRSREIYNLKREYYYVGNGGLSLRKIQTFIDICASEQSYNINIPEDEFWSKHKSDCFKVPNIDTALSFAMEEQIQRCMKRNNNELPFGCHGWYKFDLNYLAPMLEKIGIDTSGIESMQLDESNVYGGKDIYDATEEDLKEVIDFPKDKELVIGIFGTKVLGQETCALLKIYGVKNIICIDNNRERQGDKLYDKEIMSLDNAINLYGENLVIVLAIYPRRRNEVVEQLKSYNYEPGKNVFDYYEIRDKLNEKMSNELFWDEKTSTPSS